MKLKVALKDVRDEVNQIRRTSPKLRDDSAFVLWFLRAFLADSEEAAMNALTGGAGDKNIDAILLDERAKQVHMVQGKFRHSEGHLEKVNDVLSEESFLFRRISRIQFCRH